MDAADDKPWWIDIYEPSRHTFNKTNERGFEYNCIVRHRVKILVMCISRILIKINYLLTYIRSMSHMTVFDTDLAKLNVPYPNNLVNYLSNSIWCGWCSCMTDILTFTFTSGWTTGASQLVTRSTLHSPKSYNELTCGWNTVLWGVDRRLKRRALAAVTS